MGPFVLVLIAYFFLLVWDNGIMGTISAILIGIIPEALAGTLANSIACFFLLSPMVQVVSVYKTEGQTLELVNPTTCISMFVNCALWTIYGVFLPMPPAIPCNVLGLMASVFYILSCFGHAHKMKDPPPKWGMETAKMVGAAAALIVAVFIATALNPSLALTVGTLAMFAAIALSAAPLSVMKEVIKTKNSILFPKTQAILQLVNATFWTIVGLQKMAAQLWICNGFGWMLSVLQLYLIAKYPAFTPAEEATKKARADVSQKGQSAPSGRNKQSTATQKAVEKEGDQKSTKSSASGRTRSPRAPS